ncbi:MAG: metal ABC transporter permease [Planctomycetota bacterium]
MSGATEESPPADDVLVHLEGASVGYGGKPLVEKVDLAIRRGDFIAIVGPNGSGKTTILRTILGTLKPMGGRVRVAATLGYSPQRSQLDPIFPFTSEEVVAMGLLGLEEVAEEIDVAGNRRRVLGALEACGMLAMRDRLFRELSGGQKQRVLVARALVSEPEILILDEPTNDLDLRGEYEVMELVRGLHRDGRTVVMVSHILPVVARYAHTIALLSERRLIVDEAERILTGEHLERLYGIPVEVFVSETGRRFVSGEGVLSLRENWDLAIEVLRHSGDAYAATLGAAALMAYLGLFTVMRRIVFTGVALAQLAAAGVGFAFFIAGASWAPLSVRTAAAGWGPTAGSMLFSLLGAFGLQVRPHRHRSSPDALVGLVFVAAAAGAVLFVWRSANGLKELQNVLAGQVLLSNSADLFLLWFGVVAVGVVHLIYRRQFLLCSYDPEFARVLRLPERRYQLMLLGSIAIAVALALRVMGLVLVFAFLVVPPLAGLALGRRLGDATRLAVSAALAGTMIGYIAASSQDLPASQTVAISLVALLGLARLGALAAPLRWAIAGLVHALAIGAIVLALWVFPWPNFEEQAVTAGHTHGGAAGASGPSLEERRNAALVKLAGDPDAERRAAAAREIAALEYVDAKLVPALVDATADSEPAVGAAAAEALRRVLADSPMAGEYLAKLAAHPTDAEVALRGARAMIRVGRREGLLALVEALGRPDVAYFSAEESLDLLRRASGGRDFGFEAGAEPADNAAALEAWRRWYREEVLAGALRRDWDSELFLPR